MASRSRRRRRDVNKGDLTLEAALSLFLMNRDSRNYSPKTVRWYSDMLGRFAEWFGADEKIASIDANAIIGGIPRLVVTFPGRFDVGADAPVPQ